MDWHGLCLREAIKEKKESGPKHMFCIQDHPNLNPDKIAPKAATGEACPSCATPHNAGDKFCSGCGATL